MLPWLPGFLPQGFPTKSPPSHPLCQPLHSLKQLSPWIAPQSLNSSSSCCPFQGTSIPVRGKYGCGKDCLILILFRLPQISCLTLSLKCFSSDSDSCPDVEIGSVLQFPHLLRAGPVLPTVLFFSLVPSSYRVLRGSVYSFLLVRYSCLLSAGVVHALLCLKVYF